MEATSLQAELRKCLKKVADPIRAPQMQKYMKSAMPFYGVPAPQLKLILRVLLKDLKYKNQAEWQRVVLLIWQGAKFREERYAALALLRHRSAQEFKNLKQLPLLKKLIKVGAWWDFVDEIASHSLCDLFQVDEKIMTLEMTKWSSDKNLWVRRAAIISQLNRKEKTNTQLLFSCIQSNLHSKDFFINKAIGWALRQYARIDAKEVRHFVNQNSQKLAPLSIREALKHL